MAKADVVYQVEGESGGFWGVENGPYETLAKARKWVRSQKNFGGNRYIVKVTRELVE